MSAARLVVLTHWVHDEVIAKLRDHGRVWPNETRECLPPAELRRRAAGADAIMAFMPDLVDEALLSQCPRLRVVAAALKGYDNFDLQACTRHGVWLTNVPDLLTAPTADLTVGLLLAVARHILTGDAHVRSGGFRGWRPRFYGSGLAGETAGIIGMGAVGQAVARRLRAFEAEVLYVDSERLTDEGERALGVRAVGLNELLARSRYVIPLVPLTSETHHLIGRSALGRLRPGAFLINAGRGSVVDEQAVAEALASGRLAGYAADVFEMEDWARPGRPRAVPEELLAHPGTVFTPHLGSAVDSVRREVALRAADNIIAVLCGQRPPDAVNDPVAAAC